MSLSIWWNGLLDLIAPRRCPGCDLVREPGHDGFCGACAILLDPLEPTRARDAAYAFGGPLADAIRRLKYDGRTEHVAPLGRLLARASLRFAGRVDVIVPVPLHPRRLRQRGFNQAALLAAPVARMLALPLEVGALIRVRDTSEQAQLGGAERSENVRACFRAIAPRLAARVLLIDDVRSTGATFAEAALALRAAGVEEVHALALAGAER